MLDTENKTGTIILIDLKVKESARARGSNYGEGSAIKA